ncbi:hypothetical protein JK182_15130 [Acetobacter okinawensis]|uniref:hypothetical protein n=1 Tax=Acetobacter okinawensis TaxID=1076594 RepID=UPI001BA8FD6F|nr:hypothetical protein [Acetobacter okinawensis]MBS0989963.1 hypothetical protein [Acetobacter okinawensis]
MRSQAPWVGAEWSDSRIRVRRNGPVVAGGVGVGSNVVGCGPCQSAVGVHARHRAV